MKTTVTPLIPFTFARRHGILVSEIKNDTAIVHYHHKPNPTVLAELRRHLGMPLKLTLIDEDLFSKQLIHLYETDSNTAMQLAEDMGEEMDLFHKDESVVY